MTTNYTALLFKKKSNAGITAVWNKGYNSVSIFSQTNYKTCTSNRGHFWNILFATHPSLFVPGHPPPLLSPVLVLFSLLFSSTHWARGFRISALFQSNFDPGINPKSLNFHILNIGWISQWNQNSRHSDFIEISHQSQHWGKSMSPRMGSAYTTKEMTLQRPFQEWKGPHGPHCPVSSSLSRSPSQTMHKRNYSKMDANFNTAAKPDFHYI